MPKIGETRRGVGDSLKPDVRLATTVAFGALSPDQVGRALRQPKPIVRLACGVNEMGQEGGFMDKALAPTVHLAHVPGAQGDNVLLGQRGVKAMPDQSLPALLVSYYYLEQFEANRHRYHYRDWVMDSGAFSAHNSGKEIVLQDYINCCKRLMSTDPTLTEIYALDVIGDYKASLKNTEEMWKQGVPAIPCFHYGEPWPALTHLCKTYQKVAIGGCVGKRDKNEFAGQCFARVWPHRLHGFGFGSEKSLMMYPWHSVDATNWEIGACKYGHWKGFGGQRVSVRGSSQNLRVEVEWYLDLERRARERWKREMAKLEEFGPTLRLAEVTTGRLDAKQEAFGKPKSRSPSPPKPVDPTIRLAHKESRRPNKFKSKEQP